MRWRGRIRGQQGGASQQRASDNSTGEKI